MTTRPTHCLECGAPIEQNPRAPARLFCRGRKCRDDARDRRRRENRPPKPSGVAICAAPSCEREVSTAGGRIYCNAACKHRAEYHRRRQRENVKKPCVICHTLFQPAAIDERVKYCSKPCRRAAERELQRQRRHHQRPSSPPPRRIAAAPPVARAWTGDEMAAIEAAVADGKVTRIEQGQWPEADRMGLVKWDARTRKRRAG